MAASVSSDQFSCSVCLDLFTDPVSTPCGHNFCKLCLSQHWTKAPYNCPMCTKVFRKKPKLQVNTMFSEMISRFKQETERRSEVCKPGEVSCDYCTDPKLKAFKSCLVCLSSYCEQHLQPHLSVPGLKSHQLMEPVKNMLDRMCPQHQKPLELFCRSDHSCVCTMCALLEHQSHEFVSLKEEFSQRKASLQQTQEENRRMVEQRKQKIQEMHLSETLSERAVNKENTMGLKVFTALMESVQRSRDRFILELQDKQKQTQTQAEALVQQLKQEICELEKRISEAEQLQRSEDHLYFLQHCLTLPPTGLKDWSSVKLEQQTLEGTAAGALSELERRLKEILADAMKKVSKTEFKRVQHFAMNFTLDTATAHCNLSVSAGFKQVHHTDQKKFSDSPQRFSWHNVFAKQSISSGKSYFEVQVKNKTDWYLGVAKESVDRKNIDALSCKYGYWCLHLTNKKYFACTDPVLALSLKCAPQKVGVFVDYDKGLVSFYDVDSEDLLYSFTGCCFNEKLFPVLNPCPNSRGQNSAPLIFSAVKK